MANEQYKYRRDILRYLCENPGRTAAEIATGIRHPLNHVTGVLPSMYTEGLLYRDGEPGKFHYYAGKRSRARNKPLLPGAAGSPLLQSVKLKMN
jgi:hypothetical protein